MTAPVIQRGMTARSLGMSRIQAGPQLGDERGVALILTLLLALVVGAMAVGAIVMSGSATLTSRFYAREAELQASADAGLEISRDSLNRQLSLLPDTGFVTLAANAPVVNAMGATIPGFTRSLYVGRTGGRSGGVGSGGQYASNLASAVSVIQDARGAVAARRLLFSQQSWSKFAYAINSWTGGPVFGCGESVLGPFHSNTQLRMQSGCSGAGRVLFTGPVTVGTSVVNQTSGNFTRGLTVPVTAIPWPTPSDLARLRVYAQNAGPDYDLVGGPITSTQPNLRIDFVTMDINRNGQIDSDEGFFRLFRAANTSDSALAYLNADWWPRQEDNSFTTGSPPADPNTVSQNCGATVQLNGTGPLQFFTASQIYAGTTGTAAQKKTAVRNALTNASRRCYLGGDPRLFPAVTFDTLTPLAVTTFPFGNWVPRGAGPLPEVLVRHPDPNEAALYIPLQRNPNFKGVIYVTGSVTVSGRVRGRVTIAATGNIMVGDDVTYTVTPGTDCSETGDALGATTPEDFVLQDNNVNTPFRVNSNWVGLYDDTPASESFHGSVFTLKDLTAEKYSSGTGLGYTEGTIAGENCAGGKRGCFRVTGGITRGQVVDATYSSRGGWAEAHIYDGCASISPPPYFPTTGRYAKNRYYEVDPVWLNEIGIAELYRTLPAQ